MTVDSGRLDRPGRRWNAAELIVATVAFGLSVAAITTRTIRPSSMPALVAAVVFFALVPGGYIALAVGGVRQSLRLMVSELAPAPRLLAGPVVLFAATTGYVWASGLPLSSHVAIYAAYLLLPPLVFAVPPATDTHSRVPFRELIVAVALWLPIEFRALPALPLPAPNGVDMRHLMALVNAMYLFLIARPLPRIGYTYRLTWRDIMVAVGAFLVYAVVAVPIGLGTGFIAWHPRLNGQSVLAGPFIIYLVTGVPEEFLFRGLLQNLLTQWLGPLAGLAIASIVFGLAHRPDPRYMFLAAIAGLAYGWVYQRTERVTASAITHALVDATWVALLRP